MCRLGRRVECVERSSSSRCAEEQVRRSYSVRRTFRNLVASLIHCGSQMYRSRFSRRSRLIVAFVFRRTLNNDDLTKVGWRTPGLSETLCVILSLCLSVSSHVRAYYLASTRPPPCPGVTSDSRAPGKATAVRKAASKT